MTFPNLNTVCRPVLHLTLVTLILSALFLSGCAVTQPTADGTDAQGTAETEDLPLTPQVDLSAEILHQFLISELAYYRNDVLTSIDILEKLAFETNDPRIAEIASLRAIGNQQYDVASNTTYLWVMLSPDSAEAWFSNAVSMIATQRYDEAVEAFQKNLQLSTDSDQIKFQKVSHSLGSAVDPNLAFDLFDRIISEFPESIFGRLSSIELAVAAEKDEEFIDQLVSEGLAMAPKSDDMASAKFFVNIRRGAVSEAVEFAKKFLSRNPDSPNLRHHYARHLVDEGLNREAIKQYEMLTDAESLYMQGTLHEQANFPELSRDKFLAFHRLQPENQRVLINLAELALEKKDYEEAGAWISRITNRNLGFSRYLLTAKYIAGTRSIDEAVALLEEHPTESQRERVRIILVVEDLYRNDGRFDDAFSVLEAGLGEFPGNITLLLAKSYTAAELNLIDQVEMTVNAILAQQPDNALALNALGYTLIDQTDRLEEGTDYIEKALEIKPNDPFILDSMGWAHFKLGNFEDAIELLSAALSRRDDPVMAAHLGEVYWTIGRTQKARQLWDDARQKSPDNEILIETIERLTSQ
ncbi:MAG: tetratricopeptide repeat protein [Gammaproteobacteria bacterium]|nr:tetratricopeptide repeat protein [Gammaproteobacteria bacterium]